MKKFLLAALLVASTGFYLVHAENAKDNDKGKTKTAKIDDKQGYKDGDKVKVSWHCEEHLRIDSIDKAE